ncbi:MAG: hypothetical protein ABEJ40_01520 [Haloarculaceae archaeon]
MRPLMKVFRVVCVFCLVFAYWYFFIVHDSLRDFLLVAAVVVGIPGVVWVVLEFGRHRYDWGRS